MRKIIGTVVVSWTVFSALFVAFVWPYIINRINASVSAAEESARQRPRELRDTAGTRIVQQEYTSAEYAQLRDKTHPNGSRTRQ